MKITKIKLADLKKPERNVRKHTDKQRVGRGTGSGMAVVFLCTGTIGACFSFLAYRQKSIQAMRRSLMEPDPQQIHS